MSNKSPTITESNNTISFEIIDKCFNKKLGFDEYKNTAIELLKETIQILNEFNINYFLISGTLLGYVRHKDFIPWDDDIDLIVDSKITEVITQIIEKYNFKLSFLNIVDCYFYKFCFKDKVLPIHNVHNGKKIIKGDKYFWPFVDLFVYYTNDNTINFFKKFWDIQDFFPKNNVIFNGLNVSIPNKSEKILNIMYGNNYIELYKSSTWNHKKEQISGKVYEINSKCYYDYINSIEKLNVVE